MDKADRKSRIEWIDCVRAFAIILVMIGHSGAPKSVVNFVYIFHLPLFFFISGYVFKDDKYKHFSELLISKFKSLFLPAVLLGLINQLVSVLLGYSDWKSIVRRLIGAFIQLRGSPYESGLWFLICLFVVEIVYWVVVKLFKSNKLIITVILIMMIIGIAYQLFVDHICPWSIDTMLIAIGFFGAGSLLKNTNTFEAITQGRYILLSLFVLLGVFVMNQKFDYDVDMYANSYGNFLLFYIGAFSGIVFSIILFRLVDSLKALSWMGKNTLVYYAFHKSVFSILIDVCGISDWVLVLMITIVTIIPISLLINKYLPFLVGKME